MELQAEALRRLQLADEAAVRAARWDLVAKIARLRARLLGLTAP